jgi:hypothetical protein
MKTFHITKNRFLEFYFESGQDSEIEELKTNLADNIIQKLKEDAPPNITVEQLFNDCNHESIKLSFLEQYKHDFNVEGELSQLKEKFKVVLIENLIDCEDCCDEFPEEELFPYKYEPNIKLCANCLENRMEE